MSVQTVDDDLSRPLRPKLDGRNLRAEQTRRKIMAAAKALIEETNTPPKVADIAVRAGVSVRSVFQHYQDVESLFLAVYDEVMRSMTSEQDTIDVSLPLEARIAAMVERRSHAHEQVMATRQAAARFETESSPASERARRGRELSRQALVQAFDPELSRLAEPARSETLFALQAAMEWESWINMRRNYGLSVEQAQVIWRRIIRAILADSATAR